MSVLITLNARGLGVRAYGSAPWILQAVPSVCNGNQRARCLAPGRASQPQPTQTSREELTSVFNRAYWQGIIPHI